MYLLHYPYKVKVGETIYTISLLEILQSATHSILPSTHKINYPVTIKTKLRPKEVAHKLSSHGLRPTSISQNFREVLSYYGPLECNPEIDIHVRMLSGNVLIGELEPHRYTINHLFTMLFPCILPCVYEILYLLDGEGELMYRGKPCEVIENRQWVLRW